eukprot:9192897-Pyramimonas_sp.AAC.1
MCSEERCARKELFEVPGGNLVDGSPQVSIDELEEVLRRVELVPRRALRHRSARAIPARGGAIWPTRPER